MKIGIAGGLYGEYCIDPPWQEVFGPGGRAAAALSGRKLEIDLHCYFPSDQLSRAEFQAGNFGFRLVTETSPRVVSFRYLHFLSVPDIKPHRMPRLNALEVQGGDIIRYGFIEGDAVVHGDRVVYDPQDAREPKFFGENGSSAKRLAVVCNFPEASKLTGRSDPKEITDAIMARDGAEIVVLKWGGKGAIVREGDNLTEVRPYPTRIVRKIGSGDVFTAEFAYGWMVLGLDGAAAAQRASLQTAYYAQFQTLPLKSNVTEADIPVVKAPKLLSDKKYDVYLAGPFFNLGQRWVIEEARTNLSNMGLKVFSPIHDVGDGPANIVAKADIQGLHDSRFVFACLDGFDPGTVFEIGYAQSLGLPVLAYGQNLVKSDLVMFEGSGCTIIDDFVSAIYRAAFWKSVNE